MKLAIDVDIDIACQVGGKGIESDAVTDEGVPDVHTRCGKTSMSSARILAAVEGIAEVNAAVGIRHPPARHQLRHH